MAPGAAQVGHQGLDGGLVRAAQIEGQAAFGQPELGLAGQAEVLLADGLGLLACSANRLGRFSSLATAADEFDAGLLVGSVGDLEPVQAGLHLQQGLSARALGLQHQPAQAIAGLGCGHRRGGQAQAGAPGQLHAGQLIEPVLIGAERICRADDQPNRGRALFGLQAFPAAERHRGSFELAGIDLGGLELIHEPDDGLGQPLLDADGHVQLPVAGQHRAALIGLLPEAVLAHAGQQLAGLGP